MIIVSAETGKDSDLVTFKDMNSGGYFLVFLHDCEQIIQFISLIWVNYLIGGKSMCKVVELKGWKRNHVLAHAYGTQMIIHKNVLKEAMIRNMLIVTNATIDREGRLILNMNE